MGSLGYFELNYEEELDLALKNKGIVEIVMEDEYEGINYQETSHMMESNSASLDSLQGEEFTIDNENEAIKGDWVLSIIQKVMIYKIFIL